MTRVFDHTRIKELRVGLGLSLREFGVRVGTSGQAVQNWEAGATQPNLDSLIRIVNVTGAKLESFFKDAA